MSGVECWKLSNVSANTAAAIFGAYLLWRWQLQCWPKRWIIFSIRHGSSQKAEVLQIICRRDRKQVWRDYEQHVESTKQVKYRLRGRKKKADGKDIM
jgi:hypothetical protein